MSSDEPRTDEGAALAAAGTHRSPVPSRAVTRRDPGRPLLELQSVLAVQKVSNSLAAVLLSVAPTEDLQVVLRR